MIRPLSTRKMLLAAQRKLDSHLETRPASAAQAAAIAADERRREADLLAAAKELATFEPIPTGIGPGPRTIAIKHESARAHCRNLQEAGRLEQRSIGHRLAAESWERIAAEPEGETWERTRRELIQCVEFYANQLQQEESSR